MEAIRKLLQEQFVNMLATGGNLLFCSNIEGELLWDAYLGGFVNDPIFRSTESSVHNCNYCKSFVKHYGPMVAINPTTLELITLFDIDPAKVPGEYQKSIKDMSDLIRKQGKVRDVFVETFSHLADPRTPYEDKPKEDQPTYRIGVEHNIKRYLAEDVARWPKSGIKLNDVITFRHFFLDLPREFVIFGGESAESVMSKARSTQEAFKRILDEVSPEVMQTVIDLEENGSLLNATQYMESLKKCLSCAVEYKGIKGENKKNNYVWLKSINTKGAIIRKGTSLGQLLENIAKGEMSLDDACTAYNKMVDPANYKKAKKAITQKEILSAQEFVEKNGYSESFDRRCATIDDIVADQVLFSTTDAAAAKTKVSVFDSIKPTAPVGKSKVDFTKLAEVSIDEFMTELLPKCNNIELWLDNEHKNNFMTLLTSNNPASKKIFKWDNNFSWTYGNNLTGVSQLNLGQAVQQRGGSVSGVIRFTHSWNELEPNQSLMDAHVFMPGYDKKKFDGNCVNDVYPCSRRVGWNHRRDDLSGGVQDVDYVNEAPAGFIPVENITFPDINKMPEGTYIYKIHNWNFRKTGGRGRAEIAFGGNVYQYVYPATKHKEWVTVARVTLKNGRFTIDHVLPLAQQQPVEVFGVQTCQFHKVSLVCVSPNFWQEHGVGNKHYFFMVRGAKAPGKIRSIHNEFLVNDLYTNHRRVMEVLGDQLKCESTEGQLSGLGFNSTVRDEVVLKLQGDFEKGNTKFIKVKF